MDRIQINPERLKADFDTLAQIGATAEGGVHRPTFSPAHLAARDWFHQAAQAAGLEFRSDSAGNHSARLTCGPAKARTLLLGSHLDSVPNGGRFDGALGVTAALEVLRCIHEAGLSLPVHLEAIDFTDEEGTLVGLLGSRALVGSLNRRELENPRGGRPAFLEGLERAGLEEEGFFTANRFHIAEPTLSTWGVSPLAGYLELHIEQGPRLVQANVPIGVVTAIIGICSYALTFRGRADHAGTTPVGDRRDAAQGAAAFTLAVRQTVLERFPDCVANVGLLTLHPGAYNIVPAQAQVGLELRAADEPTLNRLEAALLRAAHQAARQYDLELEVHFLGKHLPAPMSESAQQAIEQAAQDLGLAVMKLTSGAGHDAQSLAPVCPAGMIFIPSQEGASHSPHEFSAWEDCVQGATVLLGATLRLAYQV